MRKPPAWPPVMCAAMSEDDAARNSEQVQKATDQVIAEIDSALAAKEKEIMQV
jgi:ribosome recycling factor